jgi:metallo-beta-lactamase family protein
MDITFFGAARAVTGSCTLVSCAGKNLLVDCGLPQGSDEKILGLDLPFKASQIDFVVLTHAHIDHSGRIPLLVKDGFTGKIVCTNATADLCSIMLADSGHIQEMEVEWINRKRRRAGKHEIDPLYGVDDAKAAMDLFEGHDYGETVVLAEGIEVKFSDAGHLLGSSSIELWLSEGTKRRHLVFSGDVGNLDQPLINNPSYFTEADVVVVESTYGDRLHVRNRFQSQAEATESRAHDLAGIIEETFSKGGNVVIPSFAVGRTQELLYLLRIIMEHGYAPSLATIPVFLDSPLAIEATKVFSRNIEGYFDAEAMELVKRGLNPLTFPSLVTTVTADESRALNTRPGSAVIISSSGMCEAGRIKHHLKHNLWRPESTIVFCGYQAAGTLGRSILDGAEQVTIFGEQIDVRATIRKLEGISGHADQDGLVKWLSHFEKKPKQVFVVHGEQQVARFFASFVAVTLGVPAWAPEAGQHFDLLSPVRFSESEVQAQLPGARELSEAYGRLDAALQALGLVVERMRQSGTGLPEDDNGKTALRLANAISRLASDIETLRGRWD